jgi:hypothetical protein
MDRIMSYLTDESLDVMLSIALRVARRLGCGYDFVGCWVGPALPWSVVALMEEYKARHASVRLLGYRRTTRRRTDATERAAGAEQRT